MQIYLNINGIKIENFHNFGQTLKFNLPKAVFMKNLWVYAMFSLIFLSSCKKNSGNSESEQASADKTNYEIYGEDFEADNKLSAAEMEERFKNLEKGDTLQLTFETTVNAVCKNKGCWMKLNLPEEEDVMVKFRDYEFFVPKNIEEKQVVVQGEAFMTEVSVEEQRHYAEDMGMTEEEIMAINQPKRTYSFVAEGVKIKK